MVNTALEHIIHPGGLVKRRLPINYKPQDEQKFKSEFQKQITPTILYKLTNVNVTVDGIVLEKKISINNQSLFHIDHKNWITSIYSLLTYLLKKRITLDKNEYILAFNYWGDGYFHWMTETIPRLVAISESMNNCILLLPQSWNQMYSMKTMLKSFFKPGIPFSKDNFHIKSIESFEKKGIQFIPYKNYMNIKKLSMPGQTADTGNYNEQLIKKTRNHYHNYYKKILTLNLGELIYISRKKAERRKIINENELIMCLKQYQFKILYWEDYTFEEQISIAFHSKYLIGLHGANLTNMMFMQENSSILEIKIEGDYYNSCYYALASALNLNYFYQFAKDTNPNQIEKDEYYFQNTDAYVNIKEFENNIKLMIAYQKKQ